MPPIVRITRTDAEGEDIGKRKAPRDEEPEKSAKEQAINYSQCHHQQTTNLMQPAH